MSGLEDAVSTRVSDALPAAAKRLGPGDQAPVREFTTVDGRCVAIGQGGRPTHVQFRRFAGCPVCNLHLQTFVRRWDEITTSVDEIVLFHSSGEELLMHAGDLPFAIVADPKKVLYRAFGVDEALRALLDPRAWKSIVLGIGGMLPDVLLGRREAPPFNPAGGRLGIPADFLIAPNGSILASRYGKHAADQWTVDEMLSHVRTTV